MKDARRRLRALTQIIINHRTIINNMYQIIPAINCLVVLVSKKVTCFLLLDCLSTHSFIWLCRVTLHFHCCWQAINDCDVRNIVLSYLVHNCFKETAETFLACTGINQSAYYLVDMHKRKCRCLSICLAHIIFKHVAQCLQKWMTSRSNSLTWKKFSSIRHLLIHSLGRLIGNLLDGTMSCFLTVKLS